MSVGDRVQVRHRLAAAESRTPFRFALGGHPIVRDGSPLAGLENGIAVTRASAGFGRGGRTLYLLALDGGAETGAGLTVSELASLMEGIGADAAVNLDGGGSSTLASRDPGSTRVTVRNHPSGGAERPVPNAIGVLASQPHGGTEDPHEIDLRQRQGLPPGNVHRHVTAHPGTGPGRARVASAAPSVTTSCASA